MGFLVFFWGGEGGGNVLVLFAASIPFQGIVIICFSAGTFSNLLNKIWVMLKPICNLEAQTMRFFIIQKNHWLLVAVACSFFASPGTNVKKESWRIVHTGGLRVAVFVGLVWLLGDFIGKIAVSWTISLWREPNQHGQKSTATLLLGHGPKVIYAYYT